MLDIHAASVNVCLPYLLEWSLCAFIELFSPQTSNFFFLDPDLIMVEQEKCLSQRLVKGNRVDCDGKWKGEDVCQQQKHKCMLVS